MPTLKKVSVHIEHEENIKDFGSLELELYSKSERTKVAMKRLVICWGASLLAIVVPIAHFLLVPGLFVAGPIAFYLGIRRTERLLTQSVLCPKCKTPVELESSKLKLPMQILCKPCRAFLDIKSAQDF